MFLKLDFKESSDLTHCPISMEALRHPILASDERHYELKALHEWVILNNREHSPCNFLPISSVIYDIQLKKRLDDSNFPNRYEDYGSEPLLSDLIAKINPQKHDKSLMPYLKRTTTTVNGCLLFFSLYRVLFDDPFAQLERFHLIFAILLIGLSDYTIRSFSNNRYNLFTSFAFGAEIF